MKKQSDVLIEALAPPPLNNNPNEAIIKLGLADTIILPKTQTAREINKEIFRPKLSQRYEKTRNPIRDPT